MRFIPPMVIGVIGLGVLPSVGSAQAPPGGPAIASGPEGIVARMMAFDRNQDGKLARDEVTDERLLRLFDRADADRNGVATKEELTAVAVQLGAEGPAAGGGRRGGPGGPGGPGGFGPGGPGGPPEPGQILPPFLRERLNLTTEQAKQLEALQKEVDARLAKILTEEQKKQLAEMRQRGPGGFGRPGGPGGPGGFGRPGGPGGFDGPGGPPGRPE